MVPDDLENVNRVGDGVEAKDELSSSRSRLLLHCCQRFLSITQTEWDGMDVCVHFKMICLTDCTKCMLARFSD